MDELNKNLKVCRYCSREMKEKEVVCGYCGYNTETGVLSSSAPKKKEKAEKNREKKSGFRIFMSMAGISIIISLAMILFSGKSKDIFSYARSLIKQSGESKQKANIMSKFIQAAKNPESKKFFEKIFPQKPGEEKSDAFFNLGGIFFDPEGKSFATVNERVVSEGESVKNIKVTKINHDSIEIEVGGKNKILKVSQSVPFAKE